MLRFFACGHDWSHASPDAPLSAEVASGASRSSSHYTEALRLDPKHRGAHEYIGEAYLMKGDVAKAKEHLATLDRLCLFGCGEYSAVKKSIAGFEQKTR